MKSLSQLQEKFPPKICVTVSGCLIIDNKILLVKHLKAGFWLKPGGHVEPEELPHLAVVREFYEETGIQVKLKKYGVFPDLKTTETEFVPVPFAANVHWVSHENYEARIASAHPEQRTRGKIWDRGCEQHYHMDFFLEPASKSVAHTLDLAESSDIGWFSLEEANHLETLEEIKSEIQYAFKLLKE